MIFDVILAILMVMAVIKGYQKGLVIALFSLIAFIIGLAAAMKLSLVVSGYLGESTGVSAKWLPVISFIIVFLVVVLLIRLIAGFIQKTFEIALLGWVNRFGGMLFYAIIYITVFSVLLFYAQQLKLLKPDTLAASSTYPFVQPWGPKAINGLGSVIPVFKDMFGQLESFFEKLSHKIP